MSLDLDKTDPRAHPAIVHGTALSGVVLRDLDCHRDERGWFMEIFQEHWDGPVEPVQWSLVQSRARVLRGPHLHLDHDEYFFVVQGEVHVGLRDLRPHSPTRDRSCMLRLRGERPTAVLFPRGLLHGWCFTQDSLHAQAVSQSYRDYHPHDNFGCAAYDPALDLPWPVTDPIRSERAEGFPSLAALEQRLELLWKDERPARSASSPP